MQNMKNRYLCKIVFQSHLTLEVKEDGTYMNKLHSPKALTQAPNNEWRKEWMNK